MDFPKRLLALRKSLDKRQLQFADELGISGTAYKTYEKGTKTIPTQVLVNICEKYQVSPGWLLMGTGKMKDEPPTKLVRAAILAAKAFQEECDLDLQPEQEAQLICKMFDQLYAENYESNAGDELKSKKAS
ncbi:XRE family transcriptional regulator [Rhodobacteraceae bacterium RKSG542]|uniref:helix-turn-helix domain-containing protein n=1 Tax=Pseudovibrio flavus TaxID=2529854 RepID=UPI0012BD4565|nr:helix-turn-helix transcriptional regulator [Pseudovibrio flavus]MTI18567.1 XRE family transcriptional regulator [Pseudovibrio flavus]